MTATKADLKVSFDATPLLGVVTGVGTFCAGALRALSEHENLSMTAFAVSWRRRGLLPPLLPPGIAAHQRAMPARPLHRAWSKTSWPPVEWFVGPTDVVHGTNFVVPPTRHAARVVTVHDLTPVLFPEMCDSPTLAFPPLVARAIGDGAFVHTHSQFVADEVISHFGADPAQVRAVAPGVPERLRVPRSPQAVDTARDVLGLLPDVEEYLLAIGTIEPRKDYPSLVRAFDLVAAERPRIALVIVGSAGWGAAETNDAVERSPHRDRIHRPGYLADEALAAVRASASMLVYPSRYEGFGFPPLEAMGEGLPVVSTTAGPLPEVLGDAAELVSPGDEQQLASAITRVLDDGELRRRLICAGQERAAAYTWDRCARGLAQLYETAWSHRSPQRYSTRWTKPTRNASPQTR